MDSSDNKRIRGYLLTRQLMLVDPDDNKKCEQLELYKPLCVGPSIALTDLLNMFQKGSSGLR